MPFFNFDRNKTFRPLKNHRKEKQHELHQYAKATLGTGDMRAAVALPEGETEEDWISAHVIDFYNEISLLYGTVCDFCTPESCPVMSAGNKFEYLWADSVTYTKPTRVSAPEYVDLLMAWIEGQITDEALFPTSTDRPFPKNFKAVAKNIFKRLFRVYAHLYHSHFSTIVELNAEAHINTCFKHFVLFVLQFDLVDRKELAALEDLIARLTGTALDGAGAPSASG